jgi:Tol biopolymer transport system component
LLVDAPDIWDYTGIWAPDGRRFVFSGSVQGNWGVYAYDETSGKTTLVSDPVRNAGLPCWSRDGKTAAWGASNTTAVQSWIMENFLPESKTSK